MQKPPIVLHAPSLPNSHLPLLQIAELVSVALSLMIGRGWNAAVTGLIAAEGKSSGHLATEAQVSLVRNYTWYYMLGAMTAAVLLSGWYANEFPTKLKKALKVGQQPAASDRDSAHCKRRWNTAELTLDDDMAEELPRLGRL